MTTESEVDYVTSDGAVFFRHELISIMSAMPPRDYNGSTRTWRTDVEEFVVRVDAQGYGAINTGTGRTYVRFQLHEGFLPAIYRVKTLATPPNLFQN